MKVVIEGSHTPSVHLATGKRATVERTPFIDKLIKRGYVLLIEEVASPAPKPVHEVMAEVETEAAPAREAAISERSIARAPSRAASTEVWAQFLDYHQVAYPEGATRTEMIARWDAVTGG